jgi:predicted nucleotidyltransferase component of viral defense system
MTESISPLKKSLNPDLIREIVAETGIKPSFVEKDWFAVQLLALLSSFKNDHGVSLVFSGGTSLSKAHGIIKRFSEDLDFVLPVTPELSMGQRRSFRQSVIAHILQDGRFKVADDDIQRGDSHRFFKAPLAYEMSFPDSSLRPYLQLEMTYAQNKIPPVSRPIRSIAAEVMGEDPEAQILCISPIETAADKLSALTWRVLVRDRQAEGDDPTLVRHLHDLAALHDEAINHREMFVTVVHQSLDQDRARRGGERIANLTAQERIEQAIKILETDQLYRVEYDKFVQDMSYADQDQRISFDRAVTLLKQVAQIVLVA